MRNAEVGQIVAWLVTYLLHSTLFLAVAWALTRRLVQSPRVRDLVWKAGVVGGVLSASVQVVLDRPPVSGTISIAPSAVVARPEPAVATGAPVAEIPGPSAVARPGATPGSAVRDNLRSFPVTSYLFWMWLGTAALLVLSYLARRARFGRALGPRTPVADASVEGLVLDLARQAGIRRPVRVTQAPHLSSPVALGLSEICLPGNALVELDSDQQVSMLAHEVAHLARRDPAWLLAVCLLERIAFFQPLNRLARRRIQDAAEYLCDDWAVQRTGSGLTLARCLVKVAEWIDTRPYPIPVSGMAERRSQFVSRIQRLISNRALAAEPPRRWLVPTAAVVVAAIGWAAPGARAIDGRTGGEADREGESASWEAAPAAPTSGSATDTKQESRGSAGRVAIQPPRLPQDTGIVAALLVALKDSDVEVRRAAAHSLGNLRDRRAVTGLIAALKDDDQEVRRAALEGLGDLRDERAIDGLVLATRDSDAEVRAAAAEALADLHDPRAITPLTTLLGDSSADVRRQAIHALKDYERGRPFEAFLKALTDPDREVRHAAAEALGDMQDRRAVEPLIAALKDASTDVRHAAAHGLGHLQDRRAMEGLILAARDANAEVRVAAVESLGELHAPEAVPALLTALTDPNGEVRHSAVEAVGEIGDPRAVAALTPLLNDPDPDIREMAVEALSEIRDQAAIQALVQAMQSKDPRVRKRAAEALGERN